MIEEALFAPKILLYHDLTVEGQVAPDTAAARFARQLDWMKAAGFRFGSLDEYVEGRLGHKDILVTFDDGLRTFLDVALPVMTERSIPSVLFACSQFAGRADARHVFLSWDELRDLGRHGVAVDSHGATHLPLDEIPPEKMVREVRVSTQRLREEGFEPRVFAYPDGRYDDRVKAAVEEAGYTAAVTVMKGGADRFEVPRRLFTGAEGSARMRLLLADHFHQIRDAVRFFVPRRFLRQDRPIPYERWGAHGFGVPDLEEPEGERIEIQRRVPGL